MTFVALRHMPYDRVVDGNFVHATGYGVVEPDGYIRYLYEDDDLWPSDGDEVIDEVVDCEW